MSVTFLFSSYTNLPLLCVRSKLMPCGGMHTFAWNGYSAEVTAVFLGVRPEAVVKLAAAASFSSSSGVQVSQRSF